MFLTSGKYSVITTPKNLTSKMAILAFYRGLKSVNVQIPTNNIQENNTYKMEIRLEKNITHETLDVNSKKMVLN